MQPSHNPSAEDFYPKYSIHAACRLTGLKAGTLRAWERRHGAPSPHRTPNGHRLYAEYDLRLVRWLSGQTEAGVAIGRAVDFLHHLQSRGQDPIALAPFPLSEPSQATSFQGAVNQDKQL